MFISITTFKLVLQYNATQIRKRTKQREFISVTMHHPGRRSISVHNDCCDAADVPDFILSLESLQCVPDASLTIRFFKFFSHSSRL